LFAGLWLVAAALCFIVAERSADSAHSRASGNPESQSQMSLGPRFRGDERVWRALRLIMQAVALGLIAFGVLLRPNALAAAPVLAAYALWPAQFRWKRVAILFVPAALGFFGLMNVVYYGVLDATRQNLLHTLFVFDLGGTSNFAKENLFPGTWTEDESRRIKDHCYVSPEWDVYWRFDPCQFVMLKIEKEQHLFGTPVLPKAWAAAIVKHPIAYLEHRTAFFWNLLSHDNLTLWVWNIEDISKPVLDGRASFALMAAIDSALKPTPLQRIGTWLLLCLGVCAFAWRRRETPEGAFALAVAGSGALYVLTYFAIGLSPDFRYGYWAMIGGIAGAVTLATRRAP